MSVRFAWRLIAGLLVLIVLTVVATSAATAARNPANLRVTAKTQTTVSLAWDSFGSSDYVLHFWKDGNWVKVTLPRTQRSYTWTGLLPNVDYFFWVKSGNAASNSIMVKTDPDLTPPSAPGNLTIGTVTASQISLAWDASTDDTGIREYRVSVSPQQGNLVWTGPTSATLVGLAPSTEFTFTVTAQDFGYHLSLPSNEASATTAASTDTTPPTAPTTLHVSDEDGCGEVELRWTQSTDDQDPQSAIRYRIFINGEPDPVGFDAIGTGRWITYGVVDGTNTFVLRAIDSAGNVSAPSNSYPIQLNIC
jgi:Fibronectin type III domain